jgi:hypothetical protein
MDFPRDECSEWFGAKQPPHDIWLKQKVDMQDYLEA